MAVKPRNCEALAVHLSEQTKFEEVYFWDRSRVLEGNISGADNTEKTPAELAKVAVEYILRGCFGTFFILMPVLCDL